MDGGFHMKSVISSTSSPAISAILSHHTTCPRSATPACLHGVCMHECMPSWHVRVIWYAQMLVWVSFPSNLCQSLHTAHPSVALRLTSDTHRPQAIIIVLHILYHPQNKSADSLQLDESHRERQRNMDDTGGGEGGGKTNNQIKGRRESVWLKYRR